MNIHEYQAKEFFADFSVPVQRGGLAETPEQARSVAEMLEGPVWVVKAQIHAGGRGKGGGVKLCRSVEEVEAAARDKADRPPGQKGSQSACLPGSRY